MAKLGVTGQSRIQMKAKGMWHNLTNRYQYSRQLGGITLRLTSQPTLTCYFQPGDDCNDIELLIDSDYCEQAINNTLNQYALAGQSPEIG